MTTLANRTILVLTALITASVAQLVVDRANQDLKAVPKDIDPDVTILKLSENSITQIEDDDMAGLLWLEKLAIAFNEIRFISVIAFLNNTELVFETGLEDGYEDVLAIILTVLKRASNLVIKAFRKLVLRAMKIRV